MDNLETPLVGSRTLQSASAARLNASASRRADGSSYGSGGLIGATPMTASRPGSLLRRPIARTGLESSNGAPGQSAVSASRRTPVSTPSMAQYGTAPRTAGSLKRSPSAAGLTNDDELAAAKRQLNRALQNIEDLKAAHEKALIEARRESSSLRGVNEEQLARIDQLEKSRATLMTQARETTEQESSVRREYEQKQAKLEKDQRELVRKLDFIQNELEQSQQQYRELEHSSAQSRRQAKEYASHVQALQGEVDRLTSERTALDKQAASERERRLAAEREAIDAKSAKAESADVHIIRDELHRQVSHLRALEKENGKLTRRLETFEKQHANVDVMRETIKSLEKQVKTTDTLRDQLAASETECEKLKREQREWSAFLDPTDADPISTPRKLTRTLAAMRIQNASFRQALDGRDLEITKRDRLVGDLELRIAELNNAVETKERSVQNLEAQAARDAHKTSLLTTELDMLRQHLESFNAEEVMHNADSLENVKNARIRQLEDLLEAHKREASEASKQLSHYRGLVERYGGNTTEIVEREERQPDTVVQQSLQKALTDLENMRDQNETLQNEIALLEKELDGLERENDRLAADGMVGFNPATTKVLELRDNPDAAEHAIRTSTLDRLRTENEALLKRIEDLSARKDANPSAAGLTVPRESYMTLKAEIEAKELKIQQKEVLLDRMKDAFGRKADEFRMAVLTILGYRIDIEPGLRVKVSSIYAPSKDYSLLFKPTNGIAGGPMELVGAGNDKHVLTEDVRSQIKFWMGERRSIPGFMASMTLTMFEETTKGGSAGFISSS